MKRTKKNFEALTESYEDQIARVKRERGAGKDELPEDEQSGESGNTGVEASGD